MKARATQVTATHRISRNGWRPSAKKPIATEEAKSNAHSCGATTVLPDARRNHRLKPLSEVEYVLDIRGWATALA